MLFLLANLRQLEEGGIWSGRGVYRTRSCLVHTLLPNPFSRLKFFYQFWPHFRKMTGIFEKYHFRTNVLHRA